MDSHSDSASGQRTAMQTPPVDTIGDSAEKVVGLRSIPCPFRPVEVGGNGRSASVSSCLSSIMTPCSPPSAGCRDSGYVTDGSPANLGSSPFAFDQSSDQPMQLSSLPSSPSMSQQLRYRQHHHYRHHRNSEYYYSHHLDQIGSTTYGAVGGHGPDTPAPSSVSSVEDHIIYESDSPDDVDNSDDDSDSGEDNDEDEEEEDDDVFVSDSVSDSFRDDSVPNYPVRASQPIPIRNPGRVNRCNNNYNNNNNNNYHLGSESLSPGLDVQPSTSYPFDDRPRHWQQLYHLRTGSEMSPELDHVGNVFIPCSWAPELRRTIGTQTHPTFRSNPLFNIAACRLSNTQQRLDAISGTNQRRPRLSEGEDPTSTNRPEPLPDIVPIPRNRAQSLPEMPLRRTNIRAVGLVLRRISDEYYQSHNTRSRPDTNGEAFSFPGANRINRVLYRILSLGRPLNAEDPDDNIPPP